MPWQASAAEKSVATEMRILNVNDGEWTHLSEDITLFSQLERLNFQNNALEELPEFIGEVQKLEWLNVIYIGGNNFTGEQRKIFRKWLPCTKIILRSEKRK